MINLLFPAVLILVGLGGGVRQTPAPWPTITPLPPVGTPTKFIPSWPTSALDTSCGSGNPLGYGTLTPSAGWLAICGHCLPQPTITATYDVNSLATQIYSTPGTTLIPGTPTITVTPTLTGGGGGATATPTVIPLPAVNNQDLWTFYHYSTSYGYAELGADPAWANTTCTVLSNGYSCTGSIHAFDGSSGWEIWVHLPISSIDNNVFYTLAINSGVENTFAYSSGWISNVSSSGIGALTNYWGPSMFAFGFRPNGDGYNGRFDYDFTFTVTTSAGTPTPTPSPSPTATGTPIPGKCQAIQTDAADVGSLPGLPDLISYGEVSCVYLREQVSNWNFGVLAAIRPYDSNFLGGGLYDMVQAILFWFLGLVPNVVQCFEPVTFLSADFAGLNVSLFLFADLTMAGWVFQRLTRK